MDDHAILDSTDPGTYGLAYLDLEALICNAVSCTRHAPISLVLQITVEIEAAAFIIRIISIYSKRKNCSQAHHNFGIPQSPTYLFQTAWTTPSPLNFPLSGPSPRTTVSHTPLRKSHHLLSVRSIPPNVIIEISIMLENAGASISGI